MYKERRFFVSIQLLLSLLLFLFFLQDYFSSTLQNDSNLDFLKGYLFFDVNTEKMLVGDFWFLVHQKSLQLMQPAIERHIAVWLWDPVFLFILQLPLVSLFLLLIILNMSIVFLSKNFRR